MTMIKKLPLEEAAQWATEALNELLEKGGASPDDENVRALETLRERAESISDRWIANMYLLVVAVLLVTLGVVCGAVGVWYAFHGAAQAAIVGKFAAGFFAAGWVSALGVQK